MSCGDRPRIGIVAGSGPDAGIDLWVKILRTARARLAAQYRGDIDAPEVAIRSVPALGLSMDLRKHRDAVRASLLTAVKEVAGLSDYFCIACHTLHGFSADVRNMGLPQRFVSMVDVTCDHVREERYRAVALLCSSETLQLGLYNNLQRYSAVEMPRDPARVNRLILDYKRHNAPIAALRCRLGTILRNLESSTVVLACTELPLMVPGRCRGKSIVDSTTLLARRMVDYCYNVQ